MQAQILGLTATPASKASLDATLGALRQLATNLGAQYVVVDERDEELLVRAGALLGGACCRPPAAALASRLERRGRAGASE